MTTLNDVVTLVFATSGAGKTTFIKEQSKAITRKTTGYTATQFQRKFGFPAIIDGDELIAETIGWPKGKWWDELPEDEYNDFVDKVLDAVASAAQRSFVVFGVFPTTNAQIDTLLNHLDSSNIEYLWVNEYHLIRNMESRAKKLPPGSVKPTDPARSLRSQQHANDLWRKYTGKPMVRQWDALPKLFVEYLELFQAGVRQIKFLNDETYLVDGLLKGGLVRVRFVSGQPAMIIAYADEDMPLDADGVVEITPSQSSLWSKWSEKFMRARRKLGSRFR